MRIWKQIPFYRFDYETPTLIANNMEIMLAQRKWMFKYKNNFGERYF